MDSYHMYATLIILCIVFIQPIQNAKGDETNKINKKQGRLLKFVSYLMKAEEVKPIVMESVKKDTLTYVKQRLLLFFRNIDKYIFKNARFVAIKQLEKVPSKHITLTFQWQEMKSNWLLPFGKDHIPLYVRKDIKALKKVKAAFFRVLQEYSDILREHINKQMLNIENDFKIIPKTDLECMKNFTNEKYVINDQVYQLLNDLKDEVMFWRRKEIEDLKYFAQRFGQERLAAPPGIANWKQGMRKKKVLDSEPLSDSGSDYNTDDITTDQLYSTEEDSSSSSEESDSDSESENEENEESIEEKNKIEEKEEDKTELEKKTKEEDKVQDDKKDDRNSNPIEELKDSAEETKKSIEQNPIGRECVRRANPEMQSILPPVSSEQAPNPTTGPIAAESGGGTVEDIDGHQRGGGEDSNPNPPPLARQSSENSHHHHDTGGLPGHHFSSPNSPQPLMSESATEGGGRGANEASLGQHLQATKSKSETLPSVPPTMSPSPQSIVASGSQGNDDMSPAPARLTTPSLSFSHSQKESPQGQMIESLGGQLPVTTDALSSQHHSSPVPTTQPASSSQPIHEEMPASTRDVPTPHLGDQRTSSGNMMGGKIIRTEIQAKITIKQRSSNGE